MIVAVASGKGGTGKTTVATSLGVALGSRAQILDCDVEEPNCHILLKPAILTSDTVSLPVPSVDLKKCSLCGKCGEVCQFSAIVPIGKTVIAFPELCHGCGSCSMFCPEKAIEEVPRNLGVVETGMAGNLEFVQGRIRIGEAMAPPLIRAVKSRINRDKFVILDAPPGASCPVITTVKGADFVIMVTEPTPFGLNDLEIAVKAIEGLGIPMGVVINRSDIGDSGVSDFCLRKALPVLMEIPHDRKIAEGYAKGSLLIESIPEYTQKFKELPNDISKIIGTI
ncbi:MAG: ATP-binding protein [Desulfomonilaceae bacterium]